MTTTPLATLAPGDEFTIPSADDPALVHRVSRHYHGATTCGIVGRQRATVTLPSATPVVLGMTMAQRRAKGAA